MDLSADFDCPTNVASLPIDTFYRGRKDGSVAEAWGGLNSYKWRFGITINRGLGWNISEKKRDGG
jgi:hypothetical protein